MTSTHARDTTEAAASLQIDLLRSFGTAGRRQRALDLISATLGMAHRGIQRRNPELADWERKVLFVEAHYGPELARAVRERLAPKS